MAVNLLTHSRKKWRALGYFVEGTECINRMPGGLVSRSDLFGFTDLLAVPVEGNGPLVFLQVTSRGNAAARVRKILTEETGKGQWKMPIRDIVRTLWLRGNRVIVEGWDKKNNRWRDQEREITLAMLEEAS